MDWHANTFTAQVCLLRSTMLKLPLEFRGAYEDLQYDTSNANEDGDGDDPLYVYQWVWHNGKVGDKEMTFTAFLAMFLPTLATRPASEHEGLIIRMHHLPAPAGGCGHHAPASAFITTMQHGREKPPARVWGTIAADEKVIAPDLMDRLVLIERVATMKPEVLAQALKISERV